MASIDVKNLWIRYGNYDAVQGVDLEVSTGKVIAVLGKNGAGKTSTIEAIEGYRRPFNGDIKVLGLNPITDRKALLPQIGVMLQVGGIYPRMNAKQALELFAGYYNDPYDPKLLIDQVQLTHVADRPYRYLSGGEKQRLALALALVNKPKVLFLDEPTAGVDTLGKGLIREIIAESASKGASVLMTTHELAEAERICDEIIVIDKGKVIASGTSEALRDRYGRSAVSFKTSTTLDVSDLESELGITIESLGQTTYRMESQSSVIQVGALTAYLQKKGIDVLELNAGKSTLEEVFLEITSKSDDQN